MNHQQVEWTSVIIIYKKIVIIQYLLPKFLYLPRLKNKLWKKIKLKSIGSIVKFRKSIIVKRERYT